MSVEAVGKYRREQFCCHLVFRIIAFILSVVCLVFSIIFLVAPLAYWEAEYYSFWSGGWIGSGYGNYYFFKYEDGYHNYEGDPYKIKYDLEAPGGMSKVHAMQGLGIATVVAAALAVLLSLVYFIQLAVYQCRRGAADDYREKIYAAATYGGDSDDSTRHSDRAPFGHREAGNEASDRVLYLQKSGERVAHINDTLKLLRLDERKRCRVNAGVGGTLMALLALMCIFSLVAVAVFADLKIKYFSVTSSAYITKTVSYRVGFALEIAVVGLAFVLIVLLAVPCIEDLGCCEESSVRDATFATNQVEPVEMEVVAVQPVSAVRRVEPNAWTLEAGGDTMYGVPMTADTSAVVVRDGGGHRDADAYYQQIHPPTRGDTHAEGTVVQQP